ncbi:MAG: PilZ domain-containing protein [Pseudomonadota bacterium]
MLNAVQGAYESALNGADFEARTKSARTLLVLIGSQSANSLGTQVARSGVVVDHARLEEAIKDAQALAMAVLTDESDPKTGFEHGQNIAWLGALYRSTQCAGSLAHTSYTPTQDSTARAHLRSVGETADSSSSMKEQPPWVWLAVGLGAIVTIAGGFWLSRAQFVRKSQVERMSRFPISLLLPITFTDPNGEIREAEGEAVDISQGGLKVRWDDPPPIGTLATLSLLGINRIGHVIWANPHFAGVMFETVLTKSELKSIKETHAPGETARPSTG